MKKLLPWTQNYLLLAAPFVITIMIWGTIQPEDEIAKSNFWLSRILWEVLAWHLMFWFTTLFLFLLSLLVVPKASEKTLTQLAQIKERDEREEFITGRAAKTAFVSGLALLLFLLFISMLSLQITQLPKEQAIYGKTGTLNLGMHFNLIDQPKVEAPLAGKIVFETRDIPISKSGIILAVLVWQLLAFHLRAKKENAAG